jgi:hypothetical protein
VRFEIKIVSKTLKTLQVCEKKGLPLHALNELTKITRFQVLCLSPDLTFPTFVIIIFCVQRFFPASLDWVHASSHFHGETILSVF